MASMGNCDQLRIDAVEWLKDEFICVKDEFICIRTNLLIYLIDLTEENNSIYCYCHITAKL